MEQATNFIPEDHYQETYRPQFHFSPEANWMNDPNGMVYYEGEYHLFYQYYPDSTIWGPMHWGHAVSKDLVSWEHLPIALYPDSLGYIFSGSAVVDWSNTSGLGANDIPPLVAIYTYHNPDRESERKMDFQYQGIAYSQDRGRSWTKYTGNPVLDNQGVPDFRDPKVFWHDESHQWIMVLAVMDHVSFYGSPNLIEWDFLSDFGIDQGAHTGVWECPDLFQLGNGISSDKEWVLLVSIGTGGDRGSATQYFVGDFDGKTFTNSHYPENVLWLDHGRDNYAGVTWSNAPNQNGEKTFIGWMSNWDYAQVVPTDKWRSAMTVPRNLTLFQTVNGIRVRSYPVATLKNLRKDTLNINRTIVNQFYDLSHLLDSGRLLDFEIIISNIDEYGSWEMELSNGSENLSFGFDDKADIVYVDRTNSGMTSFSDKFSGRHEAPRLSRDRQMATRILIDESSIEFFADLGEVVMTEMFFPTEEYDRLMFRTQHGAVLLEGKAFHLKSIWRE